jgi:hypothetical protein
MGSLVVLWGCAALPIAAPALKPVLDATGSTILQKPVAATLVDSKVKIPARKYMWWKVEVPDGSEVVFDIHVDSDVNVMLFANEEQYQSWRKEREHTKLAEAAKVVDWKYTVKATQPSVYYLVVSNTHSLLIGRNVTALIQGTFPPKQNRAVNSGIAP